MKHFLGTLFILVLTSQSFAHGEDTPGPHGGAIEMSKNMHTEVVADKDGSFHIYLLDGNIENPTIKDSTLTATVKSSGKEFKLECLPMEGTHFHCKAMTEMPKTGQLVLKAKRGSVVAGDIGYKMISLKPK